MRIPITGLQFYGVYHHSNKFYLNSDGHARSVDHENVKICPSIDTSAHRSERNNSVFTKEFGMFRQRCL